MNIQNLINKIRLMTEINDHGGSVLLLAEFLNEELHTYTIHRINQEHHQKGHLTRELNCERHGVLEALLEIVKEKHPLHYDKVYQAF